MDEWKRRGKWRRMGGQHGRGYRGKQWVSGQEGASLKMFCMTAPPGVFSCIRCRPRPTFLALFLVTAIKTVRLPVTDPGWGDACAVLPTLERGSAHCGDTEWEGCRSGHWPEYTQLPSSLCPLGSQSQVTQDPGLSQNWQAVKLGFQTQSTFPTGSPAGSS